MARMREALQAAVMMAILFCVPRAEGVALELPKQGTKCVSEEIQAHAIVLGEYSVFFEEYTGDFPTIAAKV